MIINFKDKNQKNLIVYAVVITAVISFAISGAVFFAWNHFYPGSVTFNTNKVNTQNVRKFREVRDILDRNFYKSVDQNKLLEGAIRGMAESLNDPYTVYLNKEQNKASNERIEGNYVGIGAILSPNDKEEGIIYEFFEGSPAKAAGLKVGDKILEVDGRDVSKASNISAYLKGKENTDVKLTVYRPSTNKKYEFTVTRKRIDIPCVNSEVLEGNVGYIRILIFDSKVNKEFEASLDALLKKGIKGLIIDLRGNPGGYLAEVVQIADRLLPEGKIVYTIDRYKNKMVKKSDAKQLKLPLAVLVNGNSASASEILAGAVKDFKKGILVGTKTFGKGVVQTPIEFSDGSGLNVTTSRYYTPSGVCIHGIGIKPNIEVKLDPKYNGVSVSLIPRKDDLQLNKAIEVIKEQFR